MKLIDAYLDENTGISYAIVEHTINGTKERFEGIARVHPEDTPSKFTGCRYAEMRAQIKALKTERQSLIWKCEECRKFVKACSQYKNWDKKSLVAKIIYKQLNKRIKAVNKITDKINELEWDLRIAIRQQDTVHNKLAGKRAQVITMDDSCPDEVKAEINNLF